MKHFANFVMGTIDDQAEERIKFAYRAIIGTVAGPTGFAFSMSNIELGLKILALIAGIAVSSISFFSIWQSRKEKHRIAAITIAKEERHLCDDCRDGRIPFNCPLSAEHRPLDCPHKNKM